MKSVDPDGNTTSLICKESEDKIIILQPVAASNRVGYEVNIAQVSSNDDLKAGIGGHIFPCDAEEYNDTLFSTWGFDGSNVYRAGEKTETETEGENNDNGTANDGSASQVESEQQSGNAGTNGSEETDAGNSEQDPGADAPSDVQTDPIPESEGQSGSSDDANEQPSNPDAGHNEGNEAVGEGAGTSVDEPQSDAGTSNGDLATTNDGNGDLGTSENEDKTAA